MRKESWCENVTKFLLKLKEFVQTKGISDLSVRTEHKRMGEIFRGHPNFRKKGTWNDWAYFDFSNPRVWGPCEIYCFVDFSDAPDGFRARFGDDLVERGVYAVVESSTWDDLWRIETKRPKKTGKRKRNADPEEEFEYDEFKSDLFLPIVKYTATKADGSPEPVFSVVNVETILSTCTVVPDIGSPNIFRYLVMTPRKDWSDLFIKWILQPHKFDKEDMREDDEEASSAIDSDVESNDEEEKSEDGEEEGDATEEDGEEEDDGDGEEDDDDDSAEDTDAGSGNEAETSEDDDEEGDDLEESSEEEDDDEEGDEAEEEEEDEED